MTFDGINYLAVLVAAIAAWVLGIVWYQVLWKGWLAAQRESQPDMSSRVQRPRAYILFVFAVELIMARILAEVIGRAGSVTAIDGLMWGVLCYAGFVVPLVVTESFFLGRRGMLAVINLGHWLAVFVVMGGIIGLFGVQ